MTSMKARRVSCISIEDGSTRENDIGDDTIKELKLKPLTIVEATQVFNALDVDGSQTLDEEDFRHFGRHKAAWDAIFKPAFKFEEDSSLTLRQFLQGLKLMALDDGQALIQHPAYGAVKGVITRWLQTLEPAQLQRVTLRDILAETENKFNQSILSFLGVMKQWLKETGLEPKRIVGQEQANELEDSTITVVTCYRETTEKVDMVWSALDINGDEEVNQEDIVQLNLGTEALRIWALLREDFDQDGDGTITRDEFSEGFVKQALGEKGTALYNNRQSPAAWVRAIQTQANLAIVAYAQRVAKQIPGLAGKIAAAEGGGPLMREDSGDMQADEAGASDADPEEMFRAGMLSRKLRFSVSQQFSSICDRRGRTPVLRGQGDQLSIERLRQSLVAGGQPLAVQDQICRSMDPDGDLQVTHNEFLNGLLSNVLLQSYTVITSMSPRVDPKSNGEVFLNSLRAGVQTGVMKLCDAIVVNIKKLKQ